MTRFLSVLIAILVLILAPTLLSAQDAPRPGRGEILELRRNDLRNEDGYRSFIYGSWVSGMPGLNDLLDRVNADLEGGSLVTMEQFDAANPCIVIYHREGRNGYNGICGGNSTEARVTFASFCDGDRSCVRWPMAGRVYRIPSTPRLTPGERAEEMVRTLDGTTVTETVPAPAELGGWMTELSDLMGEDQAPSYDQVRHVLAAVGRTLTRAETASAETVTDTVADPAAVVVAPTTFTEEEHLGTSADTATSRTTSAEDEVEPTSSTSDGATTSILSNPTLLWSLIAILSVALILLLIQDKLRSWFRPTILDDQEPPATDIAPPRPTVDESRGKRIQESLGKLWMMYASRFGQLTDENLNLFFMTADTNRVLVGAHEERIRALQGMVDSLSAAKMVLPVESPRVAQLEGELRELKECKSDVEAKAFTFRFEHSHAVRDHNEKIDELTKKSLKAESDLETYKDKAKSMFESFYQNGVANLELALDQASRTGDTSAPSLLNALERIAQARELFKGMVRGALNDLLIYLESDLALVPGMSDDSFMDGPLATPDPLFSPVGRHVDSWGSKRDEGESDLVTDPTEYGALVPGFGGYVSAEDPASVFPQPSGGMSIPPAELLTGERTHPGVSPPAPPDDVAFRMSKHAPPHPTRSDKKPVGRAERKRERTSKVTDSFERAPVQQTLEGRHSQDRDATVKVELPNFDRKPVPPRTKTISPGASYSTSEESPIPGSLVPPPPPIVTLDTSNGEEPASLSIFDDLPGSLETGVTVKRVLGKD